MRAGDLTPPTVDTTPHPGASATARRVRIAIEILPTAPYLWDTGAIAWDDPDPDRYVWDAPFIGSGYTNVVCDFTALTIETGGPDDAELFPAARLEMSLDNRTGAYSELDAAGRLVYYAVGRRIAVWGVDSDGQEWWLFSGRVSRWDVNADLSVTVEAFDGLSLLAQEVSTPWNAGAAGQTADARIAAILALWAYPDPTDLATSPTPMVARPTVDNPPLEELQITALSDGGLLFVDADGVLLFRGRDFANGRPDQTATPAFSDNICEPYVWDVWALEQASHDDQLARQVRLTNTAGLTAVATDPAPELGVQLILTHPDPDVWRDQADGDRLAADLLARHSVTSLAFAFDLYPLSPHHDYWRVVLDLRLGDAVRVVRTQPAQGGGLTVLDFGVLVAAVRHEITPDEWVTHVETTRAYTYRDPQFWDANPFTWDDDAAANAWSF